ncbi:copper-binding protein [Halomicroarcula sp. F13]|uniref:Copper-binding protein n=4 Tax=Haloarcula TaxID=2237 RepID=A0A8J8C9M9_9EURY|nr:MULTISPECIES: plastocyanin/azurin family copper-binding protein [Haloarculaceae]MBX0305517.1 copper-binding protein [Halomicroarcula salinisoli]MBX0324815.1 copper-binding protein [Halomicroarcula rubra]MDS0261753.1 plastocyanin/azurin family copper-binding protein [Haloarcula sp. S1CR25-12]MDS0283782.1 plastocyanin/azurin family copper-binding protein [Halomicroarcula sp. S3CR25-11]
MSLEIYDRRTVLRLSTATMATLSTAGCLGGQSSSVQTVTMPGDLKFDPKTAMIKPGGSVTWTNESEIEHTVTAYEDEIPDAAAYFASGGFESERAARNRVSEGLIAPGESYEQTFDQPGTYGYFCIPHEGSGMVGTVRVR